MIIRRQKSRLILTFNRRRNASLTRRPGQAIQVGEDIKIVLAEIKGKQARIGIDAPKEYQIDRDEVKTLKESEVTKYDPVRELHDRLGELFEFYQKWEDAEETVRTTAYEGTQPTCS